jgi:hypothetical protein
VIKPTRTNVSKNKFKMSPVNYEVSFINSKNNMIFLEKELKTILNCKSSKKGIQNLSIH